MRLFAIALIAALVAVFAFSGPSEGTVNPRLRSFVLYYNDMSGLTTITFAETTSPTALAHPACSWMVRNPSTSVSIVKVSDSITSPSTGITIPPGATLSGDDYRSTIRLYSASSTPVELTWESEE